MRTVCITHELAALLARFLVELLVLLVLGPRQHPARGMIGDENYAATLDVQYASMPLPAPPCPPTATLHAQSWILLPQVTGGRTSNAKTLPVNGTTIGQASAPRPMIPRIGPLHHLRRASLLRPTAATFFSTACSTGYCILESCQASVVALVASDRRGTDSFPCLMPSTHLSTISLFSMVFRLASLILG